MITSFSPEKNQTTYYPIQKCRTILDGPFKNGNRLLATLAKSTLNKYFALHPEDSIENYND